MRILSQKTENQMLIDINYEDAIVQVNENTISCRIDNCEIIMAEYQNTKRAMQELNRLLNEYNYLQDCKMGLASIDDMKERKPTYIYRFSDYE